MGKVTGIPWKGRAYLRAKYPGAFPLSESQIEVLLGLAREAPTNAYKVAKITGKAYSFVFNTLKELERRKKIVFKGKQRTEKGTTANIYDLSLDGVLLTLKREMRLADTDEWDREFIRTIIEKYSSLLPLVFGKWRHFEKMKVKKIASFRLKVLVDTYAKDPLSFTRGTGFLPRMETEQLVCWFFYFQFRHFKYGKAWMTALEQDKEIRVYVIKELKAYQKRLKNVNTLIEKTLAFFEK